MVATLDGIRFDNIPECWEVIKTRHYQRIVKEWDQEKKLEDRNFFKLFAILTDTAYTSFKDTPENEVTIWNAIKWFIEQEFKFSEQVPKVLEVGGTIYSIPSNPKLLSIGQNIHARKVLDKSFVLVEKETGNFVDCDCYSMIVAIYIQPLIDGKFSIEKAKHLEKTIADMPIYLIRPIGFFLLKPVMKYGKTHAKSWRQILVNLLQRLSRMLRVWPRFKGSSPLMTYRLLGGMQKDSG